MNMTFNKIIENAERRLIAFGYSPRQDFEDQIDCVINGVAFALYGSDDGETFGFGCIFEPAADKYEDGFLEELKAKFKGTYAPFQNLMTCDDGYIHLESECNVYTDSLIDAAVNTLLADDGIVHAIKAKSYVWEEN